MRSAAALAAALLLGPVVGARAEAPNLLTYQGRLKEAGAPVTGARTVTIHLCDAESGGSCTPTGAQGVTVSNGLFRTTFTVPAAVNLSTGSWYLEVQVDAATLSPRERLTASPYAVVASTASGLAASAGRGVNVSTHLYIVDGELRFSTTTPGRPGIVYSDGSSQTTAGWHVVNAQTGSAVTGFIFPGLLPDRFYRLDFRLKWNTTTGILLLRFNGDTGSNYIWTVHGIDEAAAAANSAAAPATLIDLVGTGATVGVGNIITGHFAFTTQPGTGSLVAGIGETIFQASGGLFQTNKVGGRWSGAGNLNEARLVVGAGSMDGNAVLSELRP